MKVKKKKLVSLRTWPEPKIGGAFLAFPQTKLTLDSSTSGRVFFDLWAFFLDLSAFFWDFCAIWYLLYYKDVEKIREGRVGLQMVLYVQRKIRAVVFLPLG